MLDTLPQHIEDFMTLEWDGIKPFYAELEGEAVTPGNLTEWLAGWTRLYNRLEETGTRLYLAMAVDTADPEAERRFHDFLENVFPKTEAADQALKQKLLDSGLEPEGFAIPLRQMRADAAQYREENLPLQVEEQKLAVHHDKIIGAQTVEWEGEELTLEALKAVYEDPDRAKRSRAWRLEMDRWLADRETLNKQWVKFLAVRRQLAENAGFEDYRAYIWPQLGRFDYSPADCETFQQAILTEVVPAAARIYERRRARLGVETLRPWDVDVDPLGRPALRPFEAGGELEAKTARIFQQLNPQLAAYFETMRAEYLLDLDNRKGKAPGGFCMDLPVQKKPYIFMNAVGVHKDVRTILHEAGHAFHVFETAQLPYHQQNQYGMEIAEVASMTMELFTAPYLSTEGSFYSEADAARARIEHLEEVILFWPYMAVVDAFQHWVYTHLDEALDTDNCDATWARLWDQYRLGEDWTGLELEKKTGWHRKLHIHQSPFYYIEYGLAAIRGRSDLAEFPGGSRGGPGELPAGVEPGGHCHPARFVPGRGGETGV